MSEKTYTLAELGISEAAAQALVRGRAVVVPREAWAPRTMFETGASLIDDALGLGLIDLARFQYGQFLATSPFGPNANAPQKEGAA